MSCCASNFSGDVSRFTGRCGSSSAAASRFRFSASLRSRVGFAVAPPPPPEEEEEGPAWPGSRICGLRSAPLRWSASRIDSDIFDPVTESTLT